MQYTEIGGNSREVEVKVKAYSIKLVTKLYIGRGNENVANA